MPSSTSPGEPPAMIAASTPSSSRLPTLTLLRVIRQAGTTPPAVLTCIGWPRVL
ncbi:hypothetical protein D3C75_1317520 [compost metagenome]